MSRLPTGRRYNEFDPDTRSTIEQLGLVSAQVHKAYLDRELKPFRKGRTIILTGMAGNYGGTAASGVLTVIVQLPTVDNDGNPGTETVQFRARGINQATARQVRGHRVRILVDTRTNQVFFDDVDFG